MGAEGGTLLGRKSKMRGALLKSIPLPPGLGGRRKEKEKESYLMVYIHTEYL